MKKFFSGRVKFWKKSHDHPTCAGDDTSGDLLSSSEILSTGSRFNEATSVFKIHILLSIRCYARRVLSMQSAIILCRHYQIYFHWFINDGEENVNSTVLKSYETTRPQSETLWVRCHGWMGLLTWASESLLGANEGGFHGSLQIPLLNHPNRGLIWPPPII